jgi:hypothetical protein
MAKKNDGKFLIQDPIFSKDVLQGLTSVVGNYTVKMTKDLPENSIHPGILGKSNKAFISASGYEGNIVVYTVNLYRFDGSKIDQHPHLILTKDDKIVFSGVWEHADFKNRTADVKLSQSMNISLSASNVFPNHTNEPIRSSGKLSDLPPEGELVYFTGPASKILEEYNKYLKQAK